MGQAALDDVDQQAFVGLGPAGLEGRCQVQVQEYRFHRQAGAGLLGQHLQADRFLGLQCDDQAVRVGGIGLAGEDRERQVGELDDDLGAPGLQPLAGAQEDGHARPARVVDAGAQRHEGFGRAASGHVGLLPVARHGQAVHRAGAVLEIVAGIGHCLDLNPAQTAGVGDHRTGHPGKDHARQDVRLTKSPGHESYHLSCKQEYPLGEAGNVQNLRSQNIEGNREKRR